MKYLSSLLLIAVIFLIACNIPEPYQDKTYCEKDTDCVRQASCCNCGLGNYVNTYHYQGKSCTVECDCEVMPSSGVCKENTCQGKPVDAPDKTFCVTDEDCICDGIDSETRDCFIGNKEYYEAFVDKTMGCPDFCTGISGNLVTQCVDNTCRSISQAVKNDLTAHWKCKNGLFVQKPSDCYENICKTDANCLLKKMKGECGNELVALPGHAFPAEFVETRCEGEECHVKTPDCTPREVIDKAVCQLKTCVGVQEPPPVDCVVDDDCEKAGCSGTVCLPHDKAEEFFTTCVWNLEDICYRGTPCGCVEGSCVWDKDEDFFACVEEQKALHP